MLIPFFAWAFFYNYIRYGSMFDNGYKHISPHIALFSPKYIPQAFLGLIFSPGRSVFFFSPILVLFPFYIKEFYKNTDRKFFITLCSVMATYIIFYFNYHGWDGGWCYGPRFMLVITPFMVMPLVMMFQKWQGKLPIRKVLIALIIVISIVVQIVSVMSNAWLSNALKFGIDDDSWKDAPRREVGDFGSWQYFKAFFNCSYSQLLNQFKLFGITAGHMLDESITLNRIYSLRASIGIYNPDAGVSDETLNNVFLFLALVKYDFLYRTFDLWWLQNPGGLTTLIALILMLTAVAAAFGIRRHWRE